MMCVFIGGVALGVVIGWTWGTTAEFKLWVDALCGREKIVRKRSPNE